MVLLLVMVAATIVGGLWMWLGGVWTADGEEEEEDGGLREREVVGGKEKKARRMMTTRSRVDAEEWRKKNFEPGGLGMQHAATHSTPARQPSEVAPRPTSKGKGGRVPPTSVQTSATSTHVLDEFLMITASR